MKELDRGKLSAHGLEIVNIDNYKEILTMIAESDNDFIGWNNPDPDSIPRVDKVLDLIELPKEDGSEKRLEEKIEEFFKEWIDNDKYYVGYDLIIDSNENGYVTFSYVIIEA